MKQSTLIFVATVGILLTVSQAWIPISTTTSRRSTTGSRRTTVGSVWLAASSIDKTSQQQQPTPEETTEKYGLEAGLFQSLKQKNSGESAKSLLKRYGIAYLATSIPLALVSFAICYVLVDNGVDVAGLLKQVGIENNSAGETAGTFALAYAAHKAASPIRFPPTVILTPIVAKLIGKEPSEEANEDSENPTVSN